MIDVIKCDANDAKFECLHVAAMRHDMKLIDLLLRFGANPLMESGGRYKETALQKCEWRWKLFCEQRDKNKKGDGDDDEKEQMTANKTTTNRRTKRYKPPKIAC